MIFIVSFAIGVVLLMFYMDVATPYVFLLPFFIWFLWIIRAHIVTIIILPLTVVLCVWTGAMLAEGPLRMSGTPNMMVPLLGFVGLIGGVILGAVFGKATDKAMLKNIGFYRRWKNSVRGK